MSLASRKQLIDMQRKSMDWFLYEREISKGLTEILSLLLKINFHLKNSSVILLLATYSFLSVTHNVLKI